MLNTDKLSQFKINGEVNTFIRYINVTGPGTPFDKKPGFNDGYVHGNPTTPIVKDRGPRDTLDQM